MQDLGVKDFQAVKCPSGKRVTLDIFDHIFHFSLAFRISRTAEHGMEFGINHYMSIAIAALISTCLAYVSSLDVYKRQGEDLQLIHQITDRISFKGDSQMTVEAIQDLVEVEPVSYTHLSSAR